MAYFKILVIFMAVTFACPGCSMKIYKDYAFTEPVFQLNTGVMQAKLRGTMENVDDKTSVNHSPYEMLLWFTSSVEQFRRNCLVSLNLDSMTLKNSETGKFVLIPKSFEVGFKERSDGMYTASFSYKNLNLIYADHELEFNYSFSGSCGLGRAAASVSMIFQKQYHERKTSFWDTLMGI